MVKKLTKSRLFDAIALGGFIFLFCFWVSYFGMILPGQQNPAGTEDVAIMLKKVPSVLGDSYKCRDMVQIVNHLRSLGKDKSLAVLRDFLASEKQHDKVLVICRLLFVNPKGWPRPILGKPEPAINKEVVKEFPLFPIAISDRVPFLLVMGYCSKGAGESAVECLDLCERLTLVGEDYPTSGYEKAARALTQMESFRNLYAEEDKKGMVEMILRQAETRKD